ncbi:MULTISPECIES: serine/threonine-protein kinase [unclassified Burkholderia]|uniref:serine/threonine-protein kinase n=1 Tax=unclassified Burkholderia TaxID=2613784 RepID=UPI00075E5041|nr:MULTISPECIES: serine/threonine-protein kinase [unclassified Burkholderia]KVN03139.1 serine/threonine protein kinase [Burkholderia sp. MSMB1552]KWZ49798.1 serine/threonine protein kinase [Burkholderia sp. MSMB1588]
MTDPFSRDNEQETMTRSAAAEFAVRPLPLGHRLGELQLDEVLGVGGFGIVYRAFDRTLRRAVAIKEYMPSMLATRGGDYTVSLRSVRFAQAFDAGRSAFLNEARLLAQFDHPGLVKVLHFWESHGTAYMVMPFYEGRTLKQLLDGGAQMGETQLRHIVAALLGALDTLHRAQCFHRDIALDNILIRPDGNPILLDFGAARKRIGDLVDDSAMMIKPGYAPIEQYTDDPAFGQGPWTDLYALGAVMHAMVTGELPPAAVVRSIQDTYRPLATRELTAREPYSPAFLAAIDHTLQLKIADRPESVAQFAAELGLREFERPPSPHVAPPASPAQAQPREPREPAGDREADAAEDGAQRAATSRSPDARRRDDADGGADAAAMRLDGERARQSRPPLESQESQESASYRHGDSASAAAERAGGASAAPPQQPPSTDDREAGPLRPRADHAPSLSPSREHAGERDPLPPRPAAARTGWRDRRTIAYAGGALAVSLAIGIGVAYLVKPSGRPETTATNASASPPLAATPALTPAPGSAPATLAQRAEPQPALAPPSTPADTIAHEPAPTVATTAAGASAAPQIANNDAGAASARAAPAANLAPKGSLDATETVVANPSASGGAPPVSPSVAAEAAAAADQQPPDLQETIPVRFHVRPWGDVYVSGVKRGASPPLRTLSLAPGVYQIEIRNGTLPPLRRTVKIDPGSKPVSIDYAFE